MLRQILSAMMHGSAAMMNTPPPDDAGVSKGSEEAPDAATEAYRKFQAGVSQTVFAVVQMMVAALKEVLAGEHGDAADTHGDVATEGQAVRCCTSVCATVALLCMHVMTWYHDQDLAMLAAQHPSDDGPGRCPCSRGC